MVASDSRSGLADLDASFHAATAVMTRTARQIRSVANLAQPNVSHQSSLPFVETLSRSVALGSEALSLKMRGRLQNLQCSCCDYAGSHEPVQNNYLLIPVSACPGNLVEVLRRLVEWMRRNLFDRGCRRREVCCTGGVGQHSP